jgi:tetratricopeptide (TPR) repeat protein/tRNA A-37 threonylcarbamoyl transferase component Bud32
MTKLPCPPEQWPQFSALLYAALDLPLEGRAHWLDSLAPEHAHLRAGLERVLKSAARQDISAFLQEPVIPDSECSEFAPGQSIGPYTLERELGRGGMGEVWLAARSDGTLDRRIALKLPHAHLLAGALRQRFERERNILASVSHPHIAALYDAGVSDGGYPYLAMEWIEGTPITTYCREARTSLEGRLQLLRQVLDAVNHAHSRLIAHRDLKPANILVTADGRVKLLDFGIAKLLSEETEGAATELTRLSGRAITPDYAAPEQICGQPITTAVDLYALGVVMFELLTGTRPFNSANGARAASTDAPLASRQVAGEQSQFVGGFAAARLRKALAGDLDAIIAKALETDPLRRYRSAEAFAEDIDRYRRHEPISALRIGRLMLVAKWVRRHRVASALTAGLVLALLLGATGVAWEAMRAQREARLALDAAQRGEQEARREKATKDFLVSVFKASDPRIAADKPRGAITAKELLDVSSQRIEKEFSHDPDTKIELLGILADIYMVLDETEQALRLVQEQVGLARLTDGPASAVVINGLLMEADGQSSLAHYSDALRVLDQADSLLKQAGLDASVQRAFWWYEKAGALISNGSLQEQRKAALEHAVELYAAVAPRDRNFPHALSDLGGFYYSANDYPKAKEYLRRAIAVDESGVDPDAAHLTSLYSNLGKLLTSTGELSGAVDAFQRASAMALVAYGQDNRYYWTATAHWARALHLLGEHRQANEMFNRLMPLLPPGSSPYRNAEEEEAAARVKEVYATSLLAEGLAPAAIPVLEMVLAEFAHARRDSSSELRVRGLLGQAYGRAGRTAQARRCFEEVSKVLFATLPADNPRVLTMRQAWGSFLLAHGELDGAERQFNEVLSQSHGSATSVGALSLGGRAQIAIARHQWPAALESSRQAVSTFERVIGSHDVRTAPQLWRIRAEALRLSGDAKGALSWAQQALDADRRFDDPASSDIVDAQATLTAVEKVIAASR